jgi:hypothetical protein
VKRIDRDNKDYSIYRNNLGAYLEGMKKLKKLTFVWPDFEHVNGIGSKCNLYHHLDMIASSITKTARLPWKVAQPGDRLRLDAVMKRTHSDSGQHVILSNTPLYNWEYFSNNMAIPGCQWIAQKYCHTLLNYGEWRVFILGGSIFHVVHTIYNKSRRTWTGQEATSWYTLDELKCVFDHNLLHRLYSNVHIY